MSALPKLSRQMGLAAGEVNEVCFFEGLIFFKEKCF